MSLKHRFFIMCGAIAAGMLIALLCNLMPVPPTVVSVGLLLLVGGVVWGGVGIRCPHCGAPLFRNYFKPYCPHCGKELDWG